MKQSEKVLAGLTAGIIASVGLWSWVVQPTIERWRAATEREESLQEKLGRWHTLVQRSPEIRGERQAVDIALTPPADETADPTNGGGDAIAGFLSHLASLTDAAGFKPSTLRYVRAEGFEPYAELRFELKAKAPLARIHDFLVKMTASDWYLRAQSLSITPQSNGEVEADMSLVALAKADSVETVEVKKPGARNQRREPDEGRPR